MGWRTCEGKRKMFGGWGFLKAPAGVQRAEPSDRQASVGIAMGILGVASAGSGSPKG